MLATRNASLLKLKFVTLLIIQKPFLQPKKWEKFYKRKLKLILILISKVSFLSFKIYKKPFGILAKILTLKMETNIRWSR